ncbi:Centrosomal protein of 44 kDa [Allomyces arbusculus]|nr:Centrosomal protein of 44 kDa [Allomyces arbusculus]
MQVGSTGDIRNLLMRLYRDLRAIKYPGRPEPADLCAGLSAVYLPIIHYVLLDAFPRVAQDLVGNNQYAMHGKRDRRFLDAVYRVLRDLFAYKPALTRDQFFHHGFAARKLLFLLDMIELVRNRARDLDRLAKLHAPVSAATVAAATSTSARSGTTGARSTSSSAPSMTHLAHQIEAATAAAAAGARGDDISYTLPVPAKDAPAPSSPPRRGTHVASSSDEGGDEDEDERDDEDHVAVRHRVDPLFVTADELREMDAVEPRPDGDGMRWSDLHKVLAYVQTSLTTLEATLRVMQGRLDAVEGAQMSAEERAKAVEAERERLVAQNEALKLENELLTKEVATLKTAMQRREPVFSALSARPPPTATAATATASASAPPPTRPSFSSAPPSPPAPARPTVPARSTAPARSAAPAPTASVQSQLNDAKAIRDAIAHRLQSTQALMQGLQRLSSDTTSPVK